MMNKCMFLIFGLIFELYETFFEFAKDVPVAQSNNLNCGKF